MQCGSKNGLFEPNWRKASGLLKSGRRKFDCHIASKLDQLMVINMSAHDLGNDDDVGIPGVLHHECHEVREQRLLTSLEQVAGGCIERASLSLVAAQRVVCWPILS